MSCSGKKGTSTNVARADVGSVSLQLRLASGAEIRTVSYTISGNGITPRTGTIDVSGNASPSVLVTGLPPGTGYTVALSATSVDGGTTCMGSATFSITAGATTSVTVGLQCRAAATTGNVSVGTTINNCPVITSVVVSPTTAAVGGTISVAATASDADPMETLTYAWTAPAMQGSFAAPSSASTTYTCTPAGPRPVTLTVGDGECEETFTVSVTCQPTTGVVCGNGVVEAGEECEPPGTATCDATCQDIPAGTGGTGGTGTGGTGGTGTGGTGTGGTGTGGTGTGGTGTGGTGTGGTGTGGTGTGGTGTGGTGTGGTGTGGTGTGGTGTGGTGTGGTGTGGTGGGTGGTGGFPPVCQMCLDNNCPAEEAGCSGLTGQDRTDCEALTACIQRTNCARGGDGQPCYCGTADIGSCLGGMANGMCKTEVEVAGKTTNAQVLGERFVDPAFPLGRAFNLYGCKAALCSTECPE